MAAAEGVGGKPYAGVVFPFPLDREFDYRVPAALRGRLKPGSRVAVPLGSRSRRGYVVSLLDAPRHEAKSMKDVARLLDEGEPLVAPDLLPLTRFVADYYGCSWGEALVASGRPSNTRLTDEYALGIGAQARSGRARCEPGCWRPRGPFAS